MNKFLSFLLIILSAGAIAAGGFVLYKNLNSTSGTATYSETSSETNISGTSYKEKIYSIGNNQYLAFTNGDYIAYDYDVNTVNGKKLYVNAKINKANQSFDAIKSEFKYVSNLDVKDYLTITYDINTSSAVTIASISVEFIALKYEIPHTVVVTLNSKTSNIHPNFEIRCNENYIDEIHF